MIPLEILMTLVTFGMKAWANKSAQTAALISGQREDRQNAREMQNPEAYSARRFSYSLASAVIWLTPVIGPMMGYPIAVSLLMWDPGFLWFEGSNEIVWTTFGDTANEATIVLFAPMYMLYALMTGFYYGEPKQRGF